MYFMAFVAFTFCKDNLGVSNISLLPIDGSLCTVRLESQPTLWREKLWLYNNP